MEERKMSEIRIAGIGNLPDYSSPPRRCQFGFKMIERNPHEIFTSADKKPLHLTLKIKNKKWNLRCADVAAAFKASAIKAQSCGLHILHYAVLRDHIHLLVEARDNNGLTRGMRSFGSSFGKAFRKIVGGKGAVLAGRFHLNVITNPTQMRNTLIYVLQNFARHSDLIKHIDRYSSATYFSGWKPLLRGKLGPVLASLRRPPSLPDHLCKPRSWLAREGWMRA